MLSTDIDCDCDPNIADLCLPRMTEAFLTWKPDYLRTNDGILMAIQTGVGLIGGIVASSTSSEIESFVYWMTFFVSGIFLLSYCSSLIETLQEKIPKIHTIVKLLLFLNQQLHDLYSNFSTFAFGQCSSSSMSYTDSSSGMPSR